VRFSFNTFNHSPFFGGSPRLPERIRLAAAAGYDFVGLIAASGADVGLVLDTWQFRRGDNHVAELRAVPSSALAFV
jgi:hypothetical protein